MQKYKYKKTNTNTYTKIQIWHSPTIFLGLTLLLKMFKPISLHILSIYFKKLSQNCKLYFQSVLFADPYPPSDYTYQLTLNCTLHLSAEMQTIAERNVTFCVLMQKIIFTSLSDPPSFPPPPVWQKTKT